MNDHRTEAERIDEEAIELLSLNLCGAKAVDHIDAAEALLSLYERTAACVAKLANEDMRMSEEGPLAILRHAADLHLRIAEARKNG